MAPSTKRTPSRLEQLRLQLVVAEAVGADADLAGGVHDPVPGDVAVGGQRVHRVADQPRLARQPGQHRDLAVGGDAPLRDARHDRVDPPISVRAGRHTRVVAYAMPDEYEGLLARNYDALYGVMRDPSGDAAFYRALAQESGGPVLELGCGTGRVLLPIAALGIPCVGVDASPAMLAVAAREEPAAEPGAGGRRAWRRSTSAARRFPLVTCPFRAFQHLLDVDAQLAALANVRRHLAPGGAFAFDIFDPKLAWLAAPGDAERLDATFTHDGVETRRFAKTRTDLATQIMDVTFRFEPAQSGRQHHRPAALVLPLRDRAPAGARRFTDVTLYGGYDRRPWRPEGETVIVARAP